MAWFYGSHLQANDKIRNDKVLKITLAKSRDLERADLYIFKTSKTSKAILLLCPGCNGNGEDLIKQPAWKIFVEKNQFGLAGLSFASPIDRLQAGYGYYYAEQGSGKLLLEGLKQGFGAEIPILLYGFSGGAHFTSSFVEWKPEKVKAWCAYSGAWWIPPRSAEVMPPGIVACGDYDVDRFGATQNFFIAGRTLGKPWTWVSLFQKGHQADSKLDDFVRQYFSSIVKNKQVSGLWYDIEKKNQLSLVEVQTQPTLATWLPDLETAKSWQSLHSP